MTNSKYYSKEDFSNVEKVDAHVHMNTVQSHFSRVAKDHNFKLISINTEVPEYPEIEQQQKIILDQRKSYADTVHYLTTLNTESIGCDGWSKSTIEYISKSLEAGALGVKVWKNIGMDLLRVDGTFIKISDPEFYPIFNFLQENNVPVLGHIGEPRNCWLPLEEMTVKNDIAYYSKHPEFHMYLHPNYPSYEDLVDSRDRILQLFPDLQFTGAHLGSMEYSVDEVAKRLDRYPNFYVDLTDRIGHLQYQSMEDRQRVIDFIYAYQDRIIYGTDLEFFDFHNEGDIRQQVLQTWQTDWAYFVTDDEMMVPALDQPVLGLKLEKNVVDKIYRENAIFCYLKKG
ncbi:amidohydrolase family protein [Membranihabitans marinus]|uniref:amidohydrolase family protein n=1 Tax=Membranihabitans marinus TaxID=1227546 RepID=UPI001F40CE87|nr:amidohydrolase family protein [Membranihabitans marinus]